MKIGDLIYDEVYGCGIIVSIWLNGISIQMRDGLWFLAEDLYDTIEVLNESR